MTQSSELRELATNRTETLALAFMEGYGERLAFQVSSTHETGAAMTDEGQPRRGRGTGENPPNRFEHAHFELDPDDGPPEEVPAPSTQFFRDASRTVIATNDSPDIPFDASLNPYRGCEHGCIYCYARPTHEYLGFSAGLDFESKIFVKEDAPELLRRELMSPAWEPKTIAISGVTDPYQPVERKLQLTRRCLEVLAEFRNPVSIVTKNRLVTRDLDVLGALAEHDAALVFVSVTTLDAELARRMEPRTSPPSFRLEAIEALTRAGIPVGVLVAPVIPGLTDHEMPAILSAAARAGAKGAGFIPLRLPHGVGPLFEDWLIRHYPGRRDRVLQRVCGMRGGRLNDPRFGSRMQGDGPIADLLGQLFAAGLRKSGLTPRKFQLSTGAFRRPGGTQLRLFE